MVHCQMKSWSKGDIDLMVITKATNVKPHFKSQQLISKELWLDQNEGGLVVIPPR